MVFSISTVLFSVIFIGICISRVKMKGVSLDLPADAPAGVYSVRLSYGEDYQIFENVLTIVE